MTFITVGSFLLSLGLFIWAAVIRDGTALLAVGFVSFASTFAGLSLWYEPKLAMRMVTNKVPDGDVVIRTRNGAFVLVRCVERLARELYIGTEYCHYRYRTKAFRAFSGNSTVLLMAAVVLLANASWTMQAATGSSYLLLNGLYWGSSPLPKSYFWNLLRYKRGTTTPFGKADEDIVE